MQIKTFNRLNTWVELYLSCLFVGFHFMHLCTCICIFSLYKWTYLLKFMYVRVYVSVCECLCVDIPFYNSLTCKKLKDTKPSSFCLSSPNFPMIHVRRVRCITSSLIHFKTYNFGVDNPWNPSSQYTEIDLV